MPIRREYISSLYRDLLGREGSEDEISGHENNPGGEEGLRQFFLGSPEYTSQRGGTQTWEDVQGVVTPVQAQAHTSDSNNPNPPIIKGDTTPPPSGGSGAGTGTGTTAPPPSAGMGQFIPKHDYSAFDTQRAQNVNASAKDAYAALSNMAPPPPFQDRAAFRAWRDKYIVPGMNALGHRVISTDDNGFTYTNYEGTFYVDDAQNLGAAAGSMQQRLQWGATPADAATRQRYASATPPATGGGGRTSGGGGSGTTSRTLNDISTLNSQLGLGAQFGGPGSPGVMNGPVQQVGQDPLSLLLTGGLADLIGRRGATPDGEDVMSRLQSIISSGGRSVGGGPGVGGWEVDANGNPVGAGPGGSGPDNITRKRFESARELLAKGERTALNDARGALAARGLLSEPGNASGAEMSTIGRVQTRNAEEFARALRDIGIEEDDAANTRLTTALQLATGMATDQARTYLATIGAGSDRQNMLAQIALESLSQNMAWNQFLAQFGLERDKAMQQIQSGNIESLMPYMALFLQLAQTTTRGYV